MDKAKKTNYSVIEFQTKYVYQMFEEINIFFQKKNRNSFMRFPAFPGFISIL